MNRRNFIKQSLFVASGLTLSKGIWTMPEQLFAKDPTLNSFSLHILTDDYETVIARVESVLKNSLFKGEKVTFTEYAIPGKHVGDIALVTNNRLIDFRSSEDNLSQSLSKLSDDLEFPRKVENPVCMKFATEHATNAAKHVNIFHKNVLIRQLDINSEQDSIHVEGSRGSLTFSLKNRAVRILSASCKHKTCVNMGSINQPGQQLVCIPNQIRIAISGTNNLGVDGVAF